MYKPLAILFFFIAQFSINALFAQRCDISLFAKSYSIENNESITAGELVTTNEQELLWLGKTKSNGGKTNALISKLTNKGTVIWSKRYFLNKYDELEFSGIFIGLNNEVIVAGSAYKVNAVTQVKIESAIVLLCIDKTGNIIWSKILDSNTTSTKDIYFLGNVIQTTNGDFILIISAGNNNPERKFISASYILRVQHDGVIKWEKQLQSHYVETTYFGSYYYKSLKQLPNGNIIIGSLYDDFDPRAVTLTKFGCYFIELNYTTGMKVWDNSYKLNDGVGFHPSEIKNISVLPNGDLSFLTHCLRESTSGKNLTPVNIITDNRGGLKSAIAYFKSNSNADSRIAAAVTNKDEQLLLFDESDTQTAILAAINSEGKLLWQKGYKGVKDPLTRLSPALITTEKKYFFASSKNNGNQISLFNVDTAETLACMASSITLESKNVTTSFIEDQTNFRSVDFNAGQFRTTEINSKNILLSSVDDCSFSTCCKDVTDTAATYILCEGDSIKIATDLVAKKTGLYYRTVKRIDGCDSILLFKVSVIKSPANLKLPVDSCLTKGDTVVLQATEGFDNYRWLNNTTTNMSNLKIKQAGKYWVTVTNSCGTKTDTITIDDGCFYPVLMPTAFTPNGDNINDIFRVPYLNKNKLISLNLYNRFGQLIFHTNNIAKGWNGEIGRVPQQTGTYVYYLEMIDASGKRISQKNTFLLIR